LFILAILFKDKSKICLPFFREKFGVSYIIHKLKGTMIREGVSIKTPASSFQFGKNQEASATKPTPRENIT